MQMEIGLYEGSSTGTADVNKKMPIHVDCFAMMMPPCFLQQLKQERGVEAMTQLKAAHSTTRLCFCKC
jgi:hypothetical protein